MEFSQEIKDTIGRINKIHNVICNNGMKYMKISSGEQVILSDNGLRILIQETGEQMMRMRMVLNHIAFQIAKENNLSVSDDDVSFPIYSKNEKKFHKFMNQHLTGLRIINPHIYSILESMQFYHGFPWVHYLQQMSNVSRHNYLKKLEYKDTKLICLGSLKNSRVIGLEFVINKNTTIDTTIKPNGLLVEKISIIENGKLKTNNKTYTAPMTITLENIQFLNDPDLNSTTEKILYFKNQEESFMICLKRIGFGFTNLIKNLQGLTPLENCFI